jgi:hypothetical protein
MLTKLFFDWVPHKGTVGKSENGIPEYYSDVINSTPDNYQYREAHFSFLSKTVKTNHNPSRAPIRSFLRGQRSNSIPMRFH